MKMITIVSIFKTSLQYEVSSLKYPRREVDHLK